MIPLYNWAASPETNNNNNNNNNYRSDFSISSSNIFNNDVFNNNIDNDEIITINKDNNNDISSSNVKKRKIKDVNTNMMTNDSDVNICESQPIYYDKARIDQIFTDPKTPIVFPRLFKMRLLQYQDGIDLTKLHPQKLGIVNVKSMHHISKVVESRGDYYRVRVCRTCSKYFALIELGSYSDLESALLLNDMYEFHQQKYDQLCLLDKIDNYEYIEKLTAKKRGVVDELPLSILLEQRMNKLNEKKDKLKKIPSTEETVNLIQHPNNDLIVRKMTFKQVLDINSLNYHVPFLLWIACNSVKQNIAAVLPAYLINITEKLNLSSKLFENTQNHKNSSGDIIVVTEGSNYSSNLLFLIVSSLYPGNLDVCKIIFARLYVSYPTTYQSSSEFIDVIKNILVEIVSFDSIVTQNDSQIELICAEHFPHCLQLFNRTFETCAYADYKLRLLSWDSDLVDSEIIIQGIQSQIESRVTILLSILTKIDELKANNSGMKLDILNSLLIKAVCTMLYACLINNTVSLIASKLAINFHKLKFALQLCNNFLPHLLSTVHNTVLLQDFFQRQSDLLVHVLIDCSLKGRDKNSNSIAYLGLEGTSNENESIDNDDEEKKQLASSLACEMYKLSLKCLNELKANGASESNNYLELTVRTFSSLFGTFVAFSLHNYNTFSNNLELNFLQVINSLCDSLIKFENCIKNYDCSILSTHTLINLNSLIENCMICSEKYVELKDQITVICSVAKRILSTSGNRFILSRQLLKNFEQTNEITLKNLEQQRPKLQKL